MTVGVVQPVVVGLWVWWEMTEWEEGYGRVHIDPLPPLLLSDETRGACQTPLPSLKGETSGHE